MHRRFIALCRPVALSALVLVLCASLTARPAAAQPSDNDLGEAAVFLPLFPSLRTLPAPTWFQPGVRASYEASSAIIGGGGAGAGIVEYDIAANDGVQALIAIQTYVDNGGGNLIPVGATPKVGLPALGEFWIHPTVLVNAQQVANPNLAVVRTTRNLNGQIVQVVRFQSSLNGAETVWEFSVASGILVFYRNSTPNPGTGTTLQSQSILLNLRTLPLPWAAGTAPNWVRPNVQMDYSGTQVNTIPGAGQIVQTYHYPTRLAAATRTWSVTLGSVFLNGIHSADSLLVSGVGQFFGGYWLPITALQLQLPTAPVLLDTDPITGVQTFMRRDAATNAIVMRQEGRAFASSLVYHPTLGSLDSMFQTIVSPFNQTDIEIHRTGGSNLSALNSQPPPDNGSSPGDITPDEKQVYLPMVVR